LIAALRKLGCQDIVTVFVGYNPDLEKAYRPDFDDIPTEEFRCYILGSDSGSQGASGPTYFIPSTFIRQPSSDSLSPIDLLNATMKAKNLDFIAAMRALIVQVGLAQLARARAAHRRLIVIEDGGYTAPILNEAALAGLTVAQMRAHYSVPRDRRGAAYWGQ
jgi:hypothetical protein